MKRRILTTSKQKDLERLRQVSEWVTLEEMVTPEFKNLCQDLVDTLKSKPNAIGLAAPQIGVLKRVIVVKLSIGLKLMINPEFFDNKKEETITLNEGCLSVIGTKGYPIRHYNINVIYLDLNSQQHEYELTGLDSVLIQHEIDHLDGILFIDRIKDITNEK